MQNWISDPGDCLQFPPQTISPAGTVDCSSAAAGYRSVLLALEFDCSSGCILGIDCSCHSCTLGCSCSGCKPGCSLDCKAEARKKREKIRCKQ